MKMKGELRDHIRSKLRASSNSRAELPKEFLFCEKGDTLIITFSSKRGFGWSGEPCNMQENSAAFEGWATALYVHYLDGKGRLCLDILPEDIPPEKEELYTEYPHYSRFLYRLLRFSQQYGWFGFSSRLAGSVRHFQHYLEHNTFTNNPDLSGGEAGVSKGLENITESRFAKEDAPLLRKLLGNMGTGEIYRQLPVGLFKEGKKVFTGGKSAIDLWTTDGDTLTVIELKAKNKMVGAITELFFYANYAYDMFVDQSNTFHKNPKHGDRGYDTLTESLQEVHGCLLLDQDSCHPLIDDRVLKVLNGTCHPHITYDQLVYHLEADVKISLK